MEQDCDTNRPTPPRNAERFRPARIDRTTRKRRAHPTEPTGIQTEHILPPRAECIPQRELIARRGRRAAALAALQKKNPVVSARRTKHFVRAAASSTVSGTRPRRAVIGPLRRARTTCGHCVYCFSSLSAAALRRLLLLLLHLSPFNVATVSRPLSRASAVPAAAKVDALRYGRRRDARTYRTVGA